jgi:hypothetical protein
MRTATHLYQFANDFDTGGFDEPFQFIERLFFPEIPRGIRNRNQDGGAMLNVQLVSNGVCQVGFRSRCSCRKQKE